MLEVAYWLMPPRPLKPVEWIGAALDELRACPEAVQDVVGYALFLAQSGDHHPAAKRLKGDLQGLVEIVDDWDGNPYRAVYTTRLAGWSMSSTPSRRRLPRASRRRATWSR